MFTGRVSRDTDGDPTVEGISLEIRESTFLSTSSVVRRDRCEPDSCRDLIPGADFLHFPVACTVRRLFLIAQKACRPPWTSLRVCFPRSDTASSRDLVVGCYGQLIAGPLLRLLL